MMKYDARLFMLNFIFEEMRIGGQREIESQEVQNIKLANLSAE